MFSLLYLVADLVLLNKPMNIDIHIRYGQQYSISLLLDNRRNHEIGPKTISECKKRS